jgi:putative transposase
MAKKAKKKKPQPFKKKRVKRAVKQQAYYTIPEDDSVIQELTERIRNAKNYMYSRLSGINSYLLIQKDNAIRDEWRKNKQLVEQFKLPARFWAITLADAIGNIKSLWSNACKKMKAAARENDNLTDEEKEYIRYVCSAPPLFGAILIRQGFKKPKRIEKLAIRETYVHNLIRRYARRYRGETPYTHSSTFHLDKNMYKYVQEDGVTYIEISTHQKNKRTRLKCSNHNVYKKNIRVTINEGVFTLAHTMTSKEKQIWTEENEVGVDKGYKTLLVSSSGHHYGEKLNSMLSQETERLNLVNKRRNPYYAKVRELEAKGEYEKAERIRLNNLGTKKYDKKKNQHDARMKSTLNAEMNRFIETEKPSRLGIEDLSFVSWDDKMPKHVRRKLNRWIKGYIDERLEFKCSLNGITYEYVNAAYTSQECHKCGCLGERKTQATFICPNCGKMDADENAAGTIRNRLNDKEITLYTPYREVKKILQKRKAAKAALV